MFYIFFIELLLWQYHYLRNDIVSHLTPILRISCTTKPMFYFLHLYFQLSFFEYWKLREEIHAWKGWTYQICLDDTHLNGLLFSFLLFFLNISILRCYHLSNLANILLKLVAFYLSPLHFVFSSSSFVLCLCFLYFILLSQVFISTL